MIWIGRKKILQLNELKNKIMKYARQAQTALDRFDMTLAQLRDMIKRGHNKKALQFMENGLMKERFEEMQNIITIAGTSGLGARGTAQTGTL